MSSKPTTKPGRQLWGIYHIDREYAHELGDPSRTVVEALTKLAAEELAARFGFGDPWAHPVTAEEAKHAQLLSTGSLHQQTNQNKIRRIHRCKVEPEQPPMNSTGQP